jgi:hypothetical protein
VCAVRWGEGERSSPPITRRTVVGRECLWGGWKQAQSFEFVRVRRKVHLTPLLFVHPLINIISLPLPRPTQTHSASSSRSPQHHASWPGGWWERWPPWGCHQPPHQHQGEGNGGQLASRQPRQRRPGPVERRDRHCFQGTKAAQQGLGFHLNQVPPGAAVDAGHRAPWPARFLHGLD